MFIVVVHPDKKLIKPFLKNVKIINIMQHKQRNKYV
jgi:hypothetical protein